MNFLKKIAIKQDANKWVDKAHAVLFQAFKADRNLDPMVAMRLVFTTFGYEEDQVPQFPSFGDGLNLFVLLAVGKELEFDGTFGDEDDVALVHSTVEEKMRKLGES